MTGNVSSQVFESYIPVYDAVPEDWEEARAFLVEQLKKIANGLNDREIGWFLDHELLSGKQLFPGTSSPNDQTFRTVLRKVIVCSPLVIGANTFAHGITVDANFTLVDMFAAATNHTTLVGEPIPNGADTLSYTATDVVITVAAAWDTCICTMEYVQEI